MDVIPAIDLRGGKVVRLRQGDYNQQTTYADNPVAVAKEFADAGAPWVHIVDLDGAAEGITPHLEVCRRIAEAIQTPLEFGGGLRNLEAIDAVLAIGVGRVVLGTAAIESPSLVQAAIARHGTSRIVVGVDARDGMVATRGWKEQSSTRIEKLLEQMATLGVRRFIYTDIARDGTLTEPNFDAVASVVMAATELGSKVIASGGVSNVAHLERLADAGAEGAIVGTAIYSGVLDLSTALRAVGG
jgi:phosphoribosylformimino-5-aminoimidazole carboxamide ribotide isomerase